MVTLPFKTCNLNGIDFRAYPDGRLERRTRGVWRIIDVTPKSDGYCSVECKSKWYRYHRIMYAAFNPGWNINDPSSIIDHIDRNPLNNAITNLRIATVSENARNRSSSSDRKYAELPKNICPIYDNRNNKWYWIIRVCIGDRRKTKCILGGDGPIPDPLPPLPADVLKTRDDFIKLHHGGFAN